MFFPYLQQKSNCDVILRCHDGSVPCHRLLLASLSPMLRSVLSGDTWDETITIMMPDISVQELDTFLRNLCEGTKEVSSTNMELLSLLGLVVSPNSQQKVEKKVTLTYRTTSSETNFKMNTDEDDPPLKMKSILKTRKLEKKTIKKTKSASEPEFCVKQESEDAIKEDPQDEADTEEPFETEDLDQDTDQDHNAIAMSLVETEIKEENQEEAEVPSNESLPHIKSDIVNRMLDQLDEEALKKEMKPKKRKRAKKMDLADEENIEKDPIWDHFTNIDCAKLNRKGSVKCNYCGKTLNFPSAAKHVWSIHQIMVDRPSRIKKSDAQSPDKKTSWIWKHLSIDPDNPFRCICQLCDKNLSRQSTEKHLRQKHGLGDQILCSICGKSFHSKYDRGKHELMHTKNYRFFCTQCGKGFYENQKLSEHMLRKHDESGEKSHQCCECGKAFKVKRDLSVHMVKYHSKNPPKPKRPKSPPGVPIYTEEEVAKKPHKCCICEKRFSKESYYNVHMKIHTGETKIECEECGKCFADKYYLKVHINVVHSDENIKPYSCSVCSKSFKQLRVLNEHMAVHSEERPYSCQKCNSSFKFKAALRTHIAKCYKNMLQHEVS